MSDIITTKSRIKEIIRESAQLKSADIDEKAHLHQDLKIDSLTLLEIALTIDQEFKTNFTEKELMSMASVQVAADMIIERLGGKPAGQAA